MLVGYFVSNLYMKTQYELLNILINYGVDKRTIYYDIADDSEVDKTQFNKMIDELQIGDTVIIIDIMNVCNNISDLLKIVSLINNKGSYLKSIKNIWLDTSKDNQYNEYMLNILHSLSQFDSFSVSEKIKENTSYTKTSISKVGRPLERSKKTNLILTLYSRNYKIVDIARKTGLSRTTIYKVLYDFNLKSLNHLKILIKII